jgi:hypothetical protein
LSDVRHVSLAMSNRRITQFGPIEKLRDCRGFSLSSIRCLETGVSQLSLIKVNHDAHFLSQIYLFLFDAILWTANFTAGPVLPTVESMRLESDVKLVVDWAPVYNTNKLEVLFAAGQSVSFTFDAGHFLEIERSIGGNSI